MIVSLGEFLRKFRVVFPGLHASVAACHYQEFFDSSRLDRIDNLIGKSKDLIMEYESLPLSIPVSMSSGAGSFFAISMTAEIFFPAWSGTIWAHPGNPDRPVLS